MSGQEALPLIDGGLYGFPRFERYHPHNAGIVHAPVRRAAYGGSGFPRGYGTSDGLVEPAVNRTQCNIRAQRFRTRRSRCCDCPSSRPSRCGYPRHTVRNKTDIPFDRRLYRRLVFRRISIRNGSSCLQRFSRRGHQYRFPCRQPLPVPSAYLIPFRFSPVSTIKPHRSLRQQGFYPAASQSIWLWQWESVPFTGSLMTACMRRVSVEGTPSA